LGHVARCRAVQRERRADAGPRPPGGGHARGQHAQPARPGGGGGDGHPPRVHPPPRRGPRPPHPGAPPGLPPPGPRPRAPPAAPRSEPGDPFRPRVGTRPAPRILPPDTSTTSVVAFPTSTPAITVTPRPPYAERPRRA